MCTQRTVENASKECISNLRQGWVPNYASPSIARSPEEGALNYTSHALEVYKFVRCIFKVHKFVHLFCCSQILTLFKQ